MSSNRPPSVSGHALVWRRPAGCTLGSCVEVATTASAVFVRDSKQHADSDQSMISFDAATWAEFTTALADLHSNIDLGGITIKSADDGTITIVDTRRDISLRFDREEWRAFTTAIADGEFP